MEMKKLVELMSWIDDDILLVEANLLLNSFEFEKSQERVNLDYNISIVATNIDSKITTKKAKVLPTVNVCRKRYIYKMCPINKLNLHVID